MSEFPAYRLYSYRIPTESHEQASQIPERLIFYNLDNIWTTSSAFCPIYRYASSKKILLNISPIGSIDNVHQ